MKRREHGVVYFVEAIGVGRVKIGWTSLPVQHRISALQTGCPVDLKLLGVVKGTKSDEKDYHTRFNRFRRQGSEWFDLSEEITVFTSKLHLPLDAMRTQAQTRAWGA